jgi:hypothetical protein
MRRADSEIQQQIESLIREEADPRERARLLILYQIAAVLIDNVAAVRETTDEFRAHRQEYETHVRREESYINQGRGMWRMAAVLMLLAQSTLGYLYYEQVDTVKQLQVAVIGQGKDMEALKERARLLDRLGRQP